MEVIHNPEGDAGEEFIASDVYIETDSGVSLYVKDYGEGVPVILIHGWPLSGEMWEYQIEFLVQSGCRVITYDRRGFGKSSQPWEGYNYNNLADDLLEIIEELELEGATLVGFSMGGGEAVRYFSRHGGKGVSKVVLASAVTPFMLQTQNNPDGMPQEDFDKMETQIRKDRMDFLENFGKTFYGVNLLNNPVSHAYLHHDMMVAACASPRATLECLKAFSSTDFRNDLAAVNVPVLIIHGDSDKTVPIKISAEKTAKMLPNARFLTYEGAPHGLFYTEKERFNQDLVDFIRS
ncbi:MAG TPA: alpha/beta hydrolase [Flavobacterium sp.]|jgi:pimeloyl-ACP methyl ester carboxylesterase